MAKFSHDGAVVFDGLIVSNWSRAVFEDMAKGGLTAANCTCCVWEDSRGALAHVATWKQWFVEHADLIIQVHNTADIRRAKTEGKTGIILGWQNTSGIDDQLSLLRVFKDLGVGVMQLTYNTQNLVGAGCYESHDGGLTDFGRDAVDEMNAAGILVDLSHVGPKTSEDAIRYSKKPVAYTHCCPAALKDIPRNKTDAQLRLIAEHDGFVGVASYAPFLRTGPNATLEDFIEALDYTINLVGEDRVGIGTDFAQGQPDDFFHWLRRDKGYGRRLVEFGVPSNTRLAVAGFGTIGDYPNVTNAMKRAGWPDARVAKVLGENWVAFLSEVWGE